MNKHASNGESIHAYGYYNFFKQKQRQCGVQLYVHMMRSMRMNTCMEIIHGSSVDRLS